MCLADLEGALAVRSSPGQIYGQGEAPMTITGLALLRHPGVRAAAAVGRPDAKWGEAVVDYRFVDALPTNNYGKVVKRELRDWLRAETADGGSR
jgi:acyl-coenzyme A synthetase/AMP-(fatty) acid ligase